ncbi:MAG: hypothetical protein EAZ89_04105 [Bacteroidetes bacterium]|nr:MAG: hypothetical protein EAZ89_04105 [Bacteroidota bacterium]
MSLFGDQYEKFRGLLRNDEMIFISASGQPGRFDPTETDLRINDIRLLTEELFDKMIRHFCIELDSRMLTDAMLDELAEIFRKHKGKKELKFRIRDESLQADIPLVASEWQVNPSGDLVRGMEELGLKWSVT